LNVKQNECNETSNGNLFRNSSNGDQVKHLRVTRGLNDAFVEKVDPPTQSDMHLLWFCEREGGTQQE